MVPVAPEPPPTVPLLAPPPLPPPDWASSAVPIVSARAIVSEKICLFIAVPPLSSFLKRDSPEGASGGDVPPLSSISCCNGGAIRGRKSRKRHTGQALDLPGSRPAISPWPWVGLAQIRPQEVDLGDGDHLDLPVLLLQGVGELGGVAHQHGRH